VTAENPAGRPVQGILAPRLAFNLDLDALAKCFNLNKLFIIRTGIDLVRVVIEFDGRVSFTRLFCAAYSFPPRAWNNRSVIWTLRRRPPHAVSRSHSPTR